MWQRDWRERLWAELDEPWDVIVVGGGITGAGILRETARAGLRTLLVEQNDFASGTSSWSSKLVHGGLRYLASGDWRLTLESVRERQALMRAAPGLVEPLTFLLPMYGHSRPGRAAMGAALNVYDLMARKKYSRYLDKSRVGWQMPALDATDLKGAFAYMDARTDDVRLVLRVLDEALADGARAANYIRARELTRANGRVNGLRLHDAVNGREADIRAKLVINATGAWADRLRKQIGAEARLRPLRGSHFLFDYARLPVAQAVTLFHPRDGRPLFAFPWEGVSLFGTTDLDHPGWPDNPPRMTDAEADYLVEALSHYFPSLGLRREQALCSYSGVRPIVSSGAADPSAESRESAIWLEDGLLSVTGGKLTTYRVTAVEALRKAGATLPELARLNAKSPILQASPAANGDARLAGRFGPRLAAMRDQMDCAAEVPGSVYRWAELRWAARHEAVENLADLMLRRTRLGLLLPAGGEAILEQVAVICSEELGWDASRWERERRAYLDHWRTAHAPA